MSNQIKFIYLSEYAFNVCEKPFSASKLTPDWFKKLETYDRNEKNNFQNKLTVENYGSNSTAKKCLPMQDAFYQGYIVPLWSDVLVSQTLNGPEISWRVRGDVFNPHIKSSNMIDTPLGYSNYVFKYVTHFLAKTPPGYSIMVRTPAGHYGLPFYAIPGIIDSDKSVIDTNIPVWVQSDFEGIVKKGTPIAQIIPFKRDNWRSNFSWISNDQYIMHLDKNFRSNIINNYVKNIWSRKKYI